MNENKIDKVVIVGGGTAGWICASLLCRIAGKGLQIELVESEEIGTVGVGEATIPQIRYLCDALKIPEAEFLASVNGTYKLGIEFVNWGKIGDRYIHTFGDVGRRLGVLDFHQVWLRARELGIDSDLANYSFGAIAAKQNKFDHVEKLGDTGLLGLGYAFHFDAALVAKLLRSISENNGVKRTEGRVAEVNLHAETGFIQSLRLESNATVSGDLFIDCSGFRSLLLGEALGVKYIDWSHWLPANSAVAVQCEGVEPLLPYTRATAHSAGWQWRIPLQNRIGNGHVYCNAYMTDDEAQNILLSNLDGAPLTESRQLRFTTGKREQFWYRNCIGLGLASGFMEPLESTSIHLIQRGITRLMQMFPVNGIKQSDIDEYNQQTVFETDNIRDFIALHYKVTHREDTPYWRYCRNMDIPESLAHRIDLFRETGRVFRVPNELFAENSWIQVMLGQGLEPEQYHPVVNVMGDDELDSFLKQIKSRVERTVSQLPLHQVYVDQYCKAAT